MFQASVLVGLAGCSASSSSDGTPRDTLKAVTAVTDAASLSIDTVRGAHPGPTIAFIAGVHGGKRSAAHALERLAIDLRGEVLRGTILIVSTAHRAAAGSGLAQSSPIDSLNLNRVFPGRADGRPTERLAYRIMTDLVARSDYLVDLHGSDGEEMVGAFAYAARPGLDPRVDSAARQLAADWGTPRVVWDTAGPRTLATSRFLQTAAHLSGVPAITVFEDGRASDESAATTAFLRGARRLLARRGMLAEETGDRPGPVMHSTREVVSATASGAWSPLRRPGARMRAGELLGTLTGSSGTARGLRATNAGVVLHIRLGGRAASGTSLAILATEP